MSIQLRSKSSKVTSSIFSVMSFLAQKHHAINLSQGFPDFDMNSELIRLVAKEMSAGKNQYAPMPGILSLRQTIAAKIQKLHHFYYDPEKEVTITAGGTQAIFNAIAAIIHPNDEAIIFEPAYDCYAPTVKTFGGLVKAFEMRPPHYEIDWDMVKRLVSVNTKLIIINSPHNPTGRILNKKDVEQLIQITRGTDIAIISDEVYEHIIFDGEQHLSLARFPELRDRAFIVASFGKLFHNTGWKVGYCVAPESLMNEFRNIHQFMVFSVNTPIQYAFDTYLKNPEPYLQLSSFFQNKRDHFADLMGQTRFTLLNCKGSYFQNVSYENISDEADVEFAKRLVTDYKVAAIPNSSFYIEKSDYKTLRFCFAKKEETLEKAVDYLIKV